MFFYKWIRSPLIYIIKTLKKIKYENKIKAC